MIEQGPRNLGATIRVAALGGTAFVEDKGRPGLGHLGVPRAGAWDWVSAQLANTLVGNPPDAATLEIAASSVVLEVLEGSCLGAAQPAPIEVRLASRLDLGFSSFRLEAGDRLELRRPPGSFRYYLAVSGGISAKAVLGSSSWDSLARIGPDPLRRGWLIQTNPGAPGRQAKNWLKDADLAIQPGPLRVLPGPHAQAVGAEALRCLVSGSWTVSPQSDRTGIRLDKEALPVRYREVAPMGMVPGAIQVTPSGEPIVLGVNHAPTGGYPVVAVVIRADLHRLGRLAPGEEVCFVLTSYPEARRAWERLLERVQRAVIDLSCCWSGDLRPAS